MGAARCRPGDPMTHAHAPSSNLLNLQPFSAPNAETAAPATDVPSDTRPGESSEDREYRLHRRFDRFGRLFGDGVVQHLMKQRVVIFGLGGVGSFAAEALARSAVGHLMLVDFDKVCITNTNRQLQALAGTVGKSKAELLAERCRLINPRADIQAKTEFYKGERADEMLTPPWGAAGDRQQDDQWDFVIDCIDNMTAKAQLIAECQRRGVPVVSSMGAAGKIDPTRIKVTDMADTEVCRMARDVRKILRKKHGFPPAGPMGVKAVWSDEHRLWPRELSYDGGQGFKCVCPHRSEEHGCDSRQLIDGTAVYVTGTFGLICGSVVVNTLTEDLLKQDPPAKAREGTMARSERD
jgi:tRNA A37 threonylcarbamoyladenosine dehydratase